MEGWRQNTEQRGQELFHTETLYLSLSLSHGQLYPRVDVHKPTNSLMECKDTVLKVTEH